ncbi:MAG: flavin reductase family protein [Candidatus Hodarchaeota archaeon]
MTIKANSQVEVDQQKISLDLQQHVLLVYPRQAILVTSKSGNEENIVTLAWTSPLSRNPPLQGIAISPKRHSHDLIKESRKFIINIPDRKIIGSVVDCGRSTGRNVDKFEKFNLTPLPSLKLGDDGPSRIAECAVHVECEVKEMVETGDHTLFIGEVVSCSVNSDLVKNGLYIPNKMEIPYHLGGHQFCFNDKKIHSF